MGFKKDQKMFNVPKISLRRYVNLQWLVSWRLFWG
jgi:hypothetical protein